MAYTPNIYYPQSYQPSYAQTMPMQAQQMPQPQPQQGNNGLIWVSGEIGAKSYLMTPNSTVMLMDSESNKFYIKSTDSAGMPTIRSYEYKECAQNVLQAPQSAQNNLSEQFVTREEYEAICDKYEALSDKIAELSKPKTARKEVKADE